MDGGGQEPRGGAPRTAPGRAARPRAAPPLESILDAVGGTPVLRLRRVVPPGGAAIYAKLESLEPGGSVKDRIALAMIMASSIVPPIYREAELDGKISLPTAEGWGMAERLGREEGLRVGHSAGAAVAGALRIARRMAEAGERGNVVTVLPDRADRYFEPRRWDRRTAW